MSILRSYGFVSNISLQNKIFLPLFGSCNYEVVFGEEWLQGLLGVKLKTTKLSISD
jgi:hypothetical protein